MPIIQPGKGDVHVDRPLTQIAVAFQQSADAFIADRVFPTISVTKQSDKFFTIPRGEWFRDEMQKRAPGTETVGRTHKVAQSSYLCDVWGLHENLADQIRANYDSPLQPEREITVGLTQAGMIRKERQWAADYFTSGLWTGDQTGVDNGAPAANQFSRWDRADSTPIEDVRLGTENVQGRTGYRPNKLVLGRQVYNRLLDHPDIVGRLDRGQTTGPAIVMRQNLAELFELDEILVMDGVFNSAVEGAADNFAFIGGKSALLVYAAPSPGIYTPSGGYTFAWTGLFGAGATGTRMKRIRDELTASDRMEIEMAFDMKLVSPDLGQFFITAIN